MMNMLQADMSKYDIYVAFLKPKPILFGENGIHWAIIIAHPGLEYGTMYHVTRGRKRGELSQYERHVRSFRPLESDEMLEKRHIAIMDSTDIDRFNTILAAVPLRDVHSWSLKSRNSMASSYGYHSEQWTIEAIMALEDWNMVPHGTCIFVEPNSPFFDS